MPNPNDETTTTKPAAGLEGLAQQFDALESAPTAGELQQQEADEEAHALELSKISKAIEKLTMGGLRAVRSRLAKNLPELADEWTDEVLAAPAAAVFPVLNKRAAKLTAMAGNYPEEAMLAVSMLPLVMGYIAAAENHSEKHKPAAPTPAPQPLRIAHSTESTQA